MSKRQHHKGKKRPRGWHRSKSSAKLFYGKLARTNRLIKKAQLDLESGEPLPEQNTPGT